MILRAEVRRREADEVAIQAVEESDDPGDQHQADQEAAQLLVFDDCRNVDGRNVDPRNIGDGAFSQPYYDIKPVACRCLDSVAPLSY